MPDHPGLTLDDRYPLGSDAGAVRRWLEPRPLRRLGQSSQHVLDPGRRGQNKHSGRVGLDAERVGRPSGREHHIADAAAASPEITLESRPSGTRFVVAMPIAQASVEKNHTKRAPDRAEIKT